MLGVVVAFGLAFGLGKVMESMIPPGPPKALLNDPKDLSPREPQVPKGPHQDEFVNNCTACHSVRLAMTQPAFPSAKWAEVVKKMVTAYGAKIEAPLDAQIVEYLSAVRGGK